MSIRLNENFQNSIPFLKGYKKLKIPIIDDAGNPAWPEVFPIQKISELRDTVGERHFSAQMMLEYVSDERVCLDPGAIHFYDDEFDVHNARIGDNKITGASLYWDPSSARQNHDGSVCVLVYRDDETRNIFVHDVVYMMVDDDDLYPLASQCEKVLDFMQKYHITRIGIETNGIGNALPEIMRNIIKARNISVNITQITNHIKKETRILNTLEPLLSTGHLYMHNKIRQTMLLSEMLSWTPNGSKEHDDGLDAISGAISMLPSPIRPIGARINLLRANTEFKI